MVVIGFAALTVAVAVVCWCFGRHGSDATRLARSADRTDRIQAVDMLRGRTDRAALETLFRLCSDGDLRVAITAVWALGESRTPRSGQLLTQILSEKPRHGRIRAEAAEALGRFKETDPAVLTDALTQDADRRVRAGAARGLRHLHQVQTMGSLFRGLSDSHEEVRREVIETMNTMMVRRFGYRPELPAEKQPRVMREIEVYLKQAGVL
jgi:HEAT repeat protein